jgi:hypothetical protein
MNSVAAPYQLRARFCGVVDFTCPWCAQIVRARVTRKTFKVRCSGKACRRWFCIGLVFHVLPPAGNGGSYLFRVGRQHLSSSNHRLLRSRSSLDLALGQAVQRQGFDSKSERS